MAGAERVKVADDSSRLHEMARAGDNRVALRRAGAAAAN
jgi:hypothetical protein